jgi:membrane protease YdiL (CAAX protease family)
MENGIQSILSQPTVLSIAFLLGAALVFYCLQNRVEIPAVLSLPWTMWQLCLFLISLDVIAAVIAIFVGPNSWFSREILGWVLLGSYQLIAVLLFLYLFSFRLPAVGLALDHRLFDFILIGMKWGFGALCVVMAMGLVLPESIMRNFNAYRYVLGNQIDLIRASTSTAISEVLKVLIGMSVVSLTEEIAYRGLLYRTLRARMRPLLATVTSAGCFLAAHGVVSVPIFLMGCGNALLFEKYGSLVPAVVIHVIWNIGLRVTVWSLVVLEVSARTFFEIGFLVTFLASLGAWATSRLRNHEKLVAL